MSKTIEQKYQKLDEIEHVLLRPSRYVGSVKPHSAHTWVLDEKTEKFNNEQLTWNPAFLKFFDEIISNSVDESKRMSSKLTVIKVSFDEGGKISVWDNGGIPVSMHKEHKQYIPEMIFGEMRSGSNFDDSDESVGTGQNGEGSSLVNIFSTEFKVETCDGKKKFTQTFTNNMRKRTKPKIVASTVPHTRITYTPDLKALGMEFDEGNRIKLVKRVYDIAACSPHLRVFLNGELIKIRSFEEYIKMYTNEYVFTKNRNWRIAVAPTDDGFQHVSFVNTTETMTGGTHIKYIKDQIVNKLRAYFKKKHKIDVRPADIGNHFRLFIDATIVNPRYASQTKENLITEVREYKTEFTVTDKYIQELVESPIIQSVLDWVEAKANAAEKAELRKLSKTNTKSDPRRIVKLCDATEKRQRDKCILFITEGDSASKAIQSARSPKTMAVYPAKGKPPNVRKMDVKKLIKPTIKGDMSEFVELMTVIGLNIGEVVRHPKQLRFGQICFMTDADVDGHHIVGLFINMFHHFWPELFEMGMIYRFKTPLVKVKVGRKELEFFSEDEFDKWVKKTKPSKFTKKYFKGLGTSKTADFKGYLDNMKKYLVPLTIENDEDRDAISLAFDDKRADDRKDWLALVGD